MRLRFALVFIFIFTVIFLPQVSYAVPAVPATALSIEIIENGKLYVSVDGAGSNNPGGVTIQANKPNNSATVRSAYLACASYESRIIKDGDVKLDGVSVVWNKSVLNGIFKVMKPDYFNNVFAEVTSIVKSKINASGAGFVSFTQTEVNTAFIDGCALYVIFDDPTSPERTALILFGGQNTAGDSFSLTLINDPLPTDPLQLGLAISFGNQGISPGSGSHQCGNGEPQFSIIDVNGQRMTSCAGYSDEGSGTIKNGALITVGGSSDDNESNPDNPFQEANDGTLPRTTDDEFYTLRPFINPAPNQKRFVIDTLNPSDDDNIFAGHFFLPPATVTTLIAKLVANPNTGTSPLPVTLTASKVSGDSAGSFTYTFWWNCNDPSISVLEASQTSRCGSPNHTVSGITSSSYSPPSGPTYNTPGTYHPKVIIEQGTGVNEARAVVTVNTPLPDLIVDSLSRNPSGVVVEGQLMTFSGVVRNIGPGNAGPFDTVLQISKDNLFEDSEVVGIPHRGTLNSGSNRLETFPWTAVVGTYKYRICTDFNNEVNELNDNDNCTVTGEFTVDDSLSATLAVSPNTAPISPPTTITITANASGGPGDQPIYHYSFWWNCTDPTTSVVAAKTACGNLLADPPGGSCTVNAVGAKCDGVASNSQIVQHIYSAIGTYTPKVIIERGSSEATSNNVVNITALPPADLIVNSLGRTPSGATVNAGTNMSFSGNVVNTGPTDAPSGSRTRLEIDIDNNGSWNVVRNRVAGPISANGGFETFNFINTWTATPGTHKFRICADVPPPAPNGTVTESNEGNNCTESGSFQVVNVNSPPIADAGPNGSITEGTSVTHSGATAQDVDSNLSSYLWERISGPCSISGNISGNIGGSSINIPPGPTINAGISGSCILRLRVRDTVGAEGLDTVTYTINSSPGPGSFTLSGDSIIYVNFSPALISESTKAKVTVIPSGGFSNNVKFFVEQVCDGSGCSTTPTSKILGFRDLFNPNPLPSAQFSGGTEFSVFVSKAAADPEVDKVFSITVRGDGGNANHSKVITLILRASGPGFIEN